MIELTIFDGESTQKVDRSYVSTLKPDILVDRFECTAIYRDLLNDMVNDPLSVARYSVVKLNGNPVTGQMLLEAERGFIALYGELEQRFGPDGAAEIWCRISHLIQLEKAEL
jgi:hypothetical protein